MLETAADYIFEKHELHGIPAVSCHQSGTESMPLVLLSHDLFNSKEYWRTELQTLAQSRYMAVAMDNRGHGDRKDPDLKKQLFVKGEMNLLEVRRLIKGTADDMPRLIDYFSTKREVDPTRVGMLGASMGGYAAFRAAVIDDRIKVITPIIASPFWDDLPGDIPFIQRPDLLDDLERYSRELSPGFYPEHFYPCAVLIQIGGLDIHLNPERVATFHSVLMPHYRETPEKLALIVEENVGHECTAGMIDNALNWLSVHL